MAVLKKVPQGQGLPDTKVTALVVYTIQNNDVPRNNSDLFLELNMMFTPTRITTLSSLDFDARAGNRISLERGIGNPWVFSHPMTNLSPDDGTYYLSTEGVTYRVILENQED